MNKPLAIDLFCGLGGWTEGLLAEGYNVIGFDIEQHEYWMPDDDVEGDGSKNTKSIPNRGWTASCAVALGIESHTKTGKVPKPRTRLVKYPAQLVLQDVLTLHGHQFKDAALIVASPPCQEYSYMAMPWSRAKVIEKEYREGKRDVKKLTALFNACFRIQREAIEAAGHHIPLVVENVRGAQPWVGRSRWNYGSFHLWGDVPALMPITMPRRKSTYEGLKLPGNNSARRWEDREVQRLCDAGIKSCLLDAMGTATLRRIGKSTFGWDGKHNRTGSKSDARKAASAAIAKIPFPLAQWIAKAWKPRT